VAVSVRFTGDSTQLEKANKSVETGVNQIAGSYRKLRTEASELNRLIVAGAKLSESATEKHRRQVDLLNRSFKAGKIDQQELDAALKAVNERLKDTQQASESAFGDSALGAVSRLAAGYISLTAVIAGVRTVLADVRQEAERLADRQLASAKGIQELAQISVGGGPDLFRELAERVRRFEAAGVPSPAGVVFAAASAQLSSQDVQTLERIAESGLVGDVEGLTRAIGLARASFGAAETGSVSQLVSKAITAASVTQDRLDDLLVAISQVGPSARALGLADEQAFAGLSAVSRVFSAAEGRTRFNALLRELDKLGIRNESLEQTIKAADERRLGSAEAVQAFRVLRTSIETGEFAKLQAEISKANTGQPLKEALRFTQLDPQAAAARRREQSEASRDIALGIFGEQESVRQHQIQQFEELQARAGIDPFTRAISRRLRQAGTFFDVEPIVNLDFFRPRVQGDARGLQLLEEIAQTNRELLRIDSEIAKQRRVPVSSAPANEAAQ
jgi:hypothetical protein